MNLNKLTNIRKLFGAFGVTVEINTSLQQRLLLSSSWRYLVIEMCSKVFISVVLCVRIDVKGN